MKILLLDIETAPNVAAVWSIHKQLITVNQLIDSSKVLCWSGKWYGHPGILYDSVHQSAPDHMIRLIRDLLDIADVVVHYNGSSFDIPTLNREFLVHNLKPPAPYKQIDLLKVARKQFRFTSNKMDYIARMLKLRTKLATGGYKLWLDCMSNNSSAWKRMERYNKNDVKILESLYMKFLPWIDNHPSHGLYDESLVCPNCGSSRYQRRGCAYTKVSRYSRYQCNNCSSWFRGNKSSVTGDKLVTL